MAGLPCSVAQYLATQKPAAREHTTTQLADRTQSGHTLWTNTFAKQVGYQTINRHRTGACRCDGEPDDRTRVTNTRGAKILTIDIERLPGQFSGEFWDLNDYKGRRINPRDVTEWPRTICAAARWYGDKRVNFWAEWQPGGNETMHKALWDLYDQADIIVGHNLARFDTKKLTATWLEMGLPNPRPWKTVDTLAVARGRFSFESNTLDALCERLSIPGKVSRYDITTARNACAGNKAAQRELKSYNIGDIEATEWLYDRLRGWIPNHPNMGSTDEARCNQCGSTDLKAQPTRYRAVIIDYQLYRCGNCAGNVRGGWHSRSATTRGAT